MGSGLSMTSVNKIKELAAAREYSLALEIIDSQDLSKSLNPQFIRLCGDVYIANKRYKDARKVLLMAHKMAPEAKRVIYSLVDLYLRMGYKDLAEFYYNLYMFDAEPNLPQTNHMNYIFKKAQGCPHQEIETLLFPMYSDVMDYDWSYELYLLMMLQGKEVEAQAIKDDYIATFKNEPNVLIIEDIEQSQDHEKKLEELFYIYCKEPVADDSPEQEELRQVEKPLIEADDMRMNPREAEIQIVFDDNEKVSFGAKLKYKKHMKEQEKLAKKAEMDGEDESSSDENSPEEGSDVEAVSQQKTSIADNSDTEEQQNTDVKVSIFKKLFSRKKNEDVEDIVSEETDNEVEAEQQEEKTQGESMPEEINSDSNVDVEEIESEVEEVGVEEIDSEAGDIGVEEIYSEETSMEESGTEETIVEESGIEEPTTELEELVDEDSGHEQELVEEKLEVEENDNVMGALGDISDDEEVETATEDKSEQEITEDMGDSVMQEIYDKKKISIVTELGEDTFVNVQDLEQSLDSGNPFEEMLNHDKRSSDDEVKSSFVFEEAQLEPEDDSEYDIDDFTSEFSISDFEGESVGKLVAENASVEVDEPVTEEHFEELSKEEEIETQCEERVREEFAVEIDITEDEVSEAYYEKPESEELAEELEEPDFEELAEELEEPDFEELAEELEEPESVELAEELEEPESEEFVEKLEEPESVELAEELEEPDFEELTEEYSEESLELDAMASLEKESVYNTLKEKGSMDYPEFRTTLFPEYGQEVATVENNFNEIMSEAQDKINENLLKEEQMQREAEALLASLGIDLGSIKPTVNTDNSTLSFEHKNANNSALKQNVETQVVQSSQPLDEQIPEPVPEPENNYSPSRDELKSSLKIDSVKKNILKQIKEYR